MTGTVTPGIAVSTFTDPPVERRVSAPVVLVVKVESVWPVSTAIGPDPANSPSPAAVFTVPLVAVTSMAASFVTTLSFRLTFCPAVMATEPLGVVASAPTPTAALTLMSVPAVTVSGAALDGLVIG